MTGRAHWVLLSDGTAVVELAVASGLPPLIEPDPVCANTFGFWQSLRAAAGHPGTRRTAAALGAVIRQRQAASDE
jgi:glycerate kinase